MFFQTPSLAKWIFRTFYTTLYSNIVVKINLECFQDNYSVCSQKLHVKFLHCFSSCNLDVDEDFNMRQFDINDG